MKYEVEVSQLELELEILQLQLPTSVNFDFSRILLVATRSGAIGYWLIPIVGQW